VNIGAKVRLVGQGMRVYIVASCEEHEGMLFYRLCGNGGLFLASSLEEVAA
jgi:hypothetical protein